MTYILHLPYNDPINYGNYGLFLILGNARLTSSAVGIKLMH